MVNLLFSIHGWVGRRVTLRSAERVRSLRIDGGERRPELRQCSQSHRRSDVFGTRSALPQCLVKLRRSYASHGDAVISIITMMQFISKH